MGRYALSIIVTLAAVVCIVYMQGLEVDLLTSTYRDGFGRELKGRSRSQADVAFDPQLEGLGKETLILIDSKRSASTKQLGVHLGACHIVAKFLRSVPLLSSCFSGLGSGPRGTGFIGTATCASAGSE
jgi:hypothetical protein